MNRMERRHPDKARLIRELLDDMSIINKIKESDFPFREGDKVRLNMDVIKRHKDYSKKSARYRQFCESNAGRTFTVEYNGTMRPSVVCLREDETEPKWLFWVGDLKRAENGKPEKESVGRV